MTPSPRERAERLHGLYVIADDDPRWERDPVAQARAACRGAPAVVQLRAKHATDREVLAWAAEIRALARACGSLFFVNDRFDLALAADADGVHLGQRDLPPDRVPPEIRRRLLIGRSTHTPEEVSAARREPVDYVAFGPVFETRSKSSEYGEQGVERLAEVVRSLAPRPVVAIGGIGLSRVADVVAAGAGGVAVISAVAGAADPERATRELIASMRGAPAP